MKFYEASTPYMALIKAEDINQAKEEYERCVAEDEGELDLKDVESDYAIAMYSRVLSEDGKEVPIVEVLEDLRNEYSMTLIIDPNLI